MSRFAQKAIVLLVPLALALAWAGGETRKKEAMTQTLCNISDDIIDVVQIDENLYQGHRRENPEETLYLAHESRPSYGGPLKVAAVVDSQKTIQYVAILDSTDTHSYLEKVVNLGILAQFAGKSLEQMPKVDAISGATLSSTAVIQGVESAVQQIGAAKFGMTAIKKEEQAATPETTKLLLICSFYLSALAITSKKFKPKRKARAALLLLSVITLGFWLGAQFSISTVVSLLSGAWLQGMATYAALLCLALAVAVFLVTKRNLFCSFICPFGAVQEGLGNITGCSAPKRSRWMDWVARSWVLAVLLAALYFQTPSDAMYEPFSKAFNFIGSGIIYGLTILIVIASLVVKRPWCNLFCPGGSMFFYLRFARNSFAKKSKGPMFPLYKESKQ
jgi:NosR/NirI family nitrous oxide reductase transcriptional regulator